MRKTAIIAALALAVSAAQAQKVTFYSAAFEAGVRLHLGIGDEADVLQSQTDTITALSLAGLDLGDLRDVLYLPVVRELDLSYNRISDISPLARLDALRTLDLSHNQLEDINLLAFSPSEAMTVDVSGNYIADFSYLFAPLTCRFTILGMGLQTAKNQPFFSVSQLVALTDEQGNTSVTYRGYSNASSAAKLHCGSTSVTAVMDGNLHSVAAPGGLTAATKVVLTNGERTEATWAVPAVKRRAEGGQTITVNTGLPDNYHLQDLYVLHGTAEADGQALKYTAPAKYRPDTLCFSYYEGTVYRGSSMVFIGREDIPVGMAATPQEPAAGNGAVYDLSGRRVGDSSSAAMLGRRGIYIVGGKKVNVSKQRR